MAEGRVDQSIVDIESAAKVEGSFGPGLVMSEARGENCIKVLRLTMQKQVALVERDDRVPFLLGKPANVA